MLNRHVFYLNSLRSSNTEVLTNIVNLMVKLHGGEWNATHCKVSVKQKFMSQCVLILTACMNLAFCILSVDLSVYGHITKLDSMCNCVLIKNCV